MSENDQGKPGFEPRRAIGVFLSVFGLAVMVAAFFEMPAADKVINVAAGAAILLIGALALFLGLRKKADD